jgi:hypothetical protein
VCVCVCVCVCVHVRVHSSDGVVRPPLTAGFFQAALMISLIWKYYSVPVAVVPSKWITPLDRLVAFPTRVAGNCFLEIRWWWEIR